MDTFCWFPWAAIHHQLTCFKTSVHIIPIPLLGGMEFDKKKVMNWTITLKVNQHTVCTLCNRKGHLLTEVGRLGRSRQKYHAFPPKPTLHLSIHFISPVFWTWWTSYIGSVAWMVLSGVCLEGRLDIQSENALKKGCQIKNRQKSHEIMRVIASKPFNTEGIAVVISISQPLGPTQKTMPSVKYISLLQF